jgi:lipoic acid synthetase
VTEYVKPEVFDYYRGRALEEGFRGVASAPLVRSSMNAGEMFEGVK